MEEEARDEGGDVGCVGGDEDDGEPAPDVDEELVRPGLGGLEGDQMSAEQPPADPQRRRHTETRITGFMQVEILSFFILEWRLYVSMICLNTIMLWNISYL